MEPTTAGVRAIAAPPGALWRSHPLVLLAPLALLHVEMLGYDLRHPDRFLNGDRATERIEVIRGFAQAWQSGDVTSYIAAHGIVGDWLPQALLYMAGGQHFVIGVQIVLALASVLWVRQIALRAALGEGAATACAALYALLPHTLVFPHQLVAEAIFDPLIVLSFLLCITRAGLGGLALGAATLVRPVTALWPLVHAGLARMRGRSRAAYLVAALAPLCLWMSFMWLATGEFSMGRSGHDLGANLYSRAHRMSANLPQEERPPVRGPGQRKLTLGEYLRFVAAHPDAALAHSARDLATLTFKSGVERLLLDYFDLFELERAALQDTASGWRAQLERQGAVATLAQVLQRSPALMAGSMVGAALFALFMLAAVYGTAALLRAGGERRQQALLLAAFVVYTFATAQAVDAAQSRHRAPAEFALCLLAVAGLTARLRRYGS